MKNTFANIYANLTNSTLKELLLGAAVVIVYFALATIPSDIYFSNSKYFGNANDVYAWMNYLSIAGCVAGVLAVFIWLGYNTFKK